MKKLRCHSEGAQRPRNLKLRSFDLSAGPALRALIFAVARLGLLTAEALLEGMAAFY